MKRRPHSVDLNARQHHVDSAKDALVKASAALTEPATQETLAFALVMAATAMLYIAKADTDEQARERAMQHVAAVRIEAENDERAAKR